MEIKLIQKQYTIENIVVYFDQEQRNQTQIETKTEQVRAENGTEHKNYSNKIKNN